MRWGRRDSYNVSYANQTSGSQRYYQPGTYNSSSYRIPERRRILFYHKHRPHYGFTNFSPHQVKYGGKQYPTSEHLFQAMKVSQKIFWLIIATHSIAMQFLGRKPLLAEHIRTCSKRPSDAFSEAHRFFRTARICAHVHSDDELVTTAVDPYSGAFAIGAAGRVQILHFW